MNERRSSQRRLLALGLHLVLLAGWGYLCWLMNEDLHSRSASAAVVNRNDRGVSGSAEVAAGAIGDAAAGPSSGRQPRQRHALPG